MGSDDLNSMLKQANSSGSKKDIRTRQHLMERSFAQATCYGFKRARWRRLAGSNSGIPYGYNPKRSDPLPQSGNNSRFWEFSTEKWTFSPMDNVREIRDK